MAGREREKAKKIVNPLRVGEGIEIDRSQVVRFQFEGRAYAGYAGDTIASALAANGVKVVARSFKYHRPRGLHGVGHSMNSLVQIGRETSVNIWERPIEEGLDVRPLNAWPGLGFDLMSATQLGGRFLPVGFYYKTFIRPQWAWPLYEKVLRRAAGLGRVDIDAPLADGFVKQYLHADVVVAGGGPAGMSAALAAAGAPGVRVLLLDDQQTLGGHWRMRPERAVDLEKLRQAVEAHEQIRVLRQTTVQGWFADHWLFATGGEVLYKIRGRVTIIATGADDQPLLFDDNDRPGVMLGSAVERLLHLYGVAAGRRPLIVTANGDGWRLARDLLAAGITPAGVVDHRPRSEAADALELPGVPIFWEATVTRAEGSPAVTGGRIGRLDGSAGQRIPCDLIAVAAGWAGRGELLYQAGGRTSYEDERGEFLPQSLPAGVFAAGRVAGGHGADLQIDEGDLAGREALAFLGLLDENLAAERALIERRKREEPRRTTPHFRAIGRKSGKRFVDLDEDVTDKDVADALAEGYDSIELLKRYSTISMGPSQGRWSSFNAIKLAAELNGRTVAETGRTTARPPVRPVQLGHLAGQMMEPVRLSPLHDWHTAQGAPMMVAGLWLRPEHYGDPAAEVCAVRERVGLIDVSTLGKIKLTGPGVPALLDRLYINKFSNLKVGRVRYGVMCNGEGVVMDDGVTARVGEGEWYMSTTSSGAGQVFEWIQWWAQSGWGEGVHVTSVSEGRAAFNLAGPRARAVLAELVDEPAGLVNEAFPYMHVREMGVAGVACRLLRIGFTGELSYEIHVPAGYARHVWEALLAAGEGFGIQPFGVEAQRILRLEKGHLIVGQDTDALSDPLGAGLAWAVKFDKEDFLGQRSLSRIARDGAAQKLVGFKMADGRTVPEEGLQIVVPVEKSPRHPLGLKIIGWVTSSRLSPTLGEVIGLCWLPAELADRPGASFSIRRNGELIEGLVHHGAFVDPEGVRLRS